MKKQLTIICIIGMLLAVGFSGCLEDNKEGNRSVTPSPSGKVTVTTNKIEYRQNETINITLYNGLNVSVYSYIAGSPHDYFIDWVEKKTSEGWVVYLPVHIECEFAYPGEVKPGKSVSFEWEPLIWVPVNATYKSSQLEPGVYRISSTPRISSKLGTDDYPTGVEFVENGTALIVYSNEFYVEKEKINEVILTTNKILYERNETVNFTLFNGKNSSIYLSFGCGEFNIYSIEKKSVSGWKSLLTNDPNIDYGCQGTDIEIKQGESICLSWIAHHLWVYRESNYTYEYCLVEPRIYEIHLDYSVGYASYTVYSNEFTIDQENYFDYEPNDINNIVITLERTAGWTGPVYTLKIYGNGTVFYNGQYNVNITGTRTINITEEEVIQLISEFEKIDYFSLNETDIASHIVFDAPSCTTSLTLNGKTKTIKHYSETGPEELTELENTIDDIVNSERWINPSNVTFTVYEESKEKTYNITVYNVSLPLNKFEAITIFETIMGYKPEEPSLSSVKTDEGWEIRDFRCLPIGGDGVFIVRINQENRTVNVTGFGCI